MKKLLYLFFIAFGLQACTKAFIGGQPEVSPRDVFEELWQQINLKYSYMQYKGLDWEAVYATYSPQINPNMTDIELFRVLEAMMNELRDGHANLVAPFSISNYYPVFLNSPENFRGRLVLEHYLRRNPQEHFITGPFQHTVLDTLGKKIGLLTYRSFSSGFSSADLDFIFSRFQNVDGVIVDMRSNGGGAVNNVFQLAGRFTDVERLSHYNVMKTGPGPDDFGSEKLIRVVPSSSAIRFTGRVAMLTNRGSYSATSDFALQMRALPNARLIGDTTGGGLGLPHGASLINGWSYRFSVGMALSPETDANGNRYNWEDGIPPQIRVDLDLVQAEQGFDSMIERAIDYILNGN
jgi:hypothetical protein